MGLEPVNFEVKANGNDISGIIRDRLLRLVITDLHGDSSDTVEIELDNRDQSVQLPSTGAELAIFIGYGDDLVDKGLYQVDELEESLEVDTLVIHAKAAKVKQSFKAPRSETYDDITIADLVELIAARHGFETSVSSNLANIKYDHLNQEGESDMNLLTRIGRENGALVKPMANKLLFLTKDEAKNAKGQEIEPITIDDPQNSQGRVSIVERNNYQAVKAFWYDEGKAERQEVTAGSGEPLFTISRHYPNAEKCEAAAGAKLRALQRGSKTLNLTRPLTPEAIAEAPVEIFNHKESANGSWIIEKVTHTISASQVALSEMSLHLPK